jgi:murein DD-endopeptidase MepM/ murein hydrolase activator NlpD
MPNVSDANSLSRLRRMTVAGIACLGVSFSGYGVSQAVAGTLAIDDVASLTAKPGSQVEQVRRQVEQMRAEVAAAKQAARFHAARLEQRQALIAATLTGKSDKAAIVRDLPVAAVRTSAMADEVLAPLRQVEARQSALVGKAIRAGEARVAQTKSQLLSLGLAPERFGGMGGPFEPIDGSASDSDEEAGNAVSSEQADAQFRALFQTWKKLDMIEQTVISIPSMQPVEKVAFTSQFGVRADPFRGTAAMHAGVDIPGAIGTPIYATADGVVSHAGRQGGYGNLVQLNHGRGIETRYGHLSKILVADNTRVHRGQIIGLMGSTGRSTGSHLHYEVRIDGRAVNPIPFLQTGQYLAQAPETVEGSVGGSGK